MSMATRTGERNVAADVATRVVAGAAAGCAAAAPMAVAFEVLRRTLPEHGRDPLPPRNVAVGLSRKLGFGKYLDEPRRERLTWAGHFGYGAATGAAYGAVDAALEQSNAPVPLPPSARGATFGLIVWALSYVGWLPAVGITSPQFRRPLRQNTMLILAHLLWGALTGVLTARITAAVQHKQPPEPEGPGASPTRAAARRTEKVGAA